MSLRIIISTKYILNILLPYLFVTDFFLQYNQINVPFDYLQFTGEDRVQSIEKLPVIIWCNNWVLNGICTILYYSNNN